MTDENSPNSPADDGPESSSKAIDATLTETNVDESNGVTVADKTPSAPKDGETYKDVHSASHPQFKWHAEVLVDGHDVYEGIVKDISMKGLNLILDHNLQNSKLMKLHIHIPPPSSSSPHHVLEISGRVTSTVYDSAEESFRSGVVFSEFTLESDRTFLQSLLA